MLNAIYLRDSLIQFRYLLAKFITLSKIYLELLAVINIDMRFGRILFAML